MEVLWERGAIHERNYVDHLRGLGYGITEIEATTGIAQSQVTQTFAAMKAGVQIIAQGALIDGAWNGRTDILRRVDTPSRLGDWSYEVIDTKLARENTCTWSRRVQVSSRRDFGPQPSVPITDRSNATLSRRLPTGKASLLIRTRRIIVTAVDGDGIAMQDGGATIIYAWLPASRGFR